MNSNIFLSEEHKSRFNYLRSIRRKNDHFECTGWNSIFFVVAGFDELWKKRDKIFDRECDEILLKFEGDDDCLSKKSKIVGNWSNSEKMLLSLALQFYDNVTNPTIREIFWALDKYNTKLALNLIYLNVKDYM